MDSTTTTHPFVVGDLVIFARGRGYWTVDYVHGDGNVTLASTKTRPGKYGLGCVRTMRRYVHPSRLLKITES